MSRLWKKMRKYLRKNMWESGEKLSTVFEKFVGSMYIWWKRLNFHKNLHSFFNLFYTNFRTEYNLLVGRFYTIST